MPEAIITSQPQNPEIQLAYDFIRFTNRNVFLTGKAGTGKTTFLLNLKKLSPKRMIVVAPTGVAAINAGGVTIHSFFQLPFHPHVPFQYLEGEGGDGTPTYKLGREKMNIIKSLDLLVIDEISMVRADLLDAVDAILRRFRNRRLPFGGVQLLMIGDIQQLPPVVTKDDREILDKYYNTEFFFGSHALSMTDYITIELKHIYRQKDLEFIEILNKVRENSLDRHALEALNKCYRPGFEPHDDEGYISLTTHNSQATSINDSKLSKLPGKANKFKATVDGDFPEYAFPTLPELIIKKGAQVMFVKNDISKDKLFFNGKIGQVKDIGSSWIDVLCSGDSQPIRVEMAEWQNVKYTLNNETKEIEETVIGTFVQYPLKLAWAITIHKSQGLTFDRAIIDAKDAFAHGQVYVALSRCRTLEGMVLSSQLTSHGIKNDSVVTDFTNESRRHQPDERTLAQSKLAYEKELILELFDFEGLHYDIQSYFKTWRENKEALLGDLSEKNGEISAILLNDIREVSRKFHSQLQSLMKTGAGAGSREVIGERISKGCEYFTQKLDILNSLLDDLRFETDNRAAKKSLEKTISKIRHSINVRKACLGVSAAGFSVPAYLSAKVKADLNEEIGKKAPKPAQTEGNPDKTAHPEMFNILKAWRNKKAAELNIPHYRVIQLETMSMIAGYLPQKTSDLKKIRGMGNKKISQYGEDILDMVRNYIEMNGNEWK